MSEKRARKQIRPGRGSRAAYSEIISGTHRKQSVRLKLGRTGSATMFAEDAFGYTPPIGFSEKPQKEYGTSKRTKRKGRLRDRYGRWLDVEFYIDQIGSESAAQQVAPPMPEAESYFQQPQRWGSENTQAVEYSAQPGSPKDRFIRELVALVSGDSSEAEITEAQYETAREALKSIFSNRKQEEYDRLVESYMNGFSTLGAVAAEQARRDGNKLRNLSQSYELLNASDLLSKMDYVGTNPSRDAKRKLDNGELLAVKVGNQYKYPAFQVNEADGCPYNLIKYVNEKLDFMDGKARYYWWCKPNRRLGGTPADQIGNRNKYGIIREMAIQRRERAKGWD